jgi:hypothetical protein
MKTNLAVCFTQQDSSKINRCASTLPNGFTAAAEHETHIVVQGEELLRCGCVRSQSCPEAACTQSTRKQAVLSENG